MGDESYERLAIALGALPGGFPKTPSKVELRLLKKAFTEEEAKIAGHMSRNYWTVSELARRVGTTQRRVRELLQGLVPANWSGCGSSIKRNCTGLDIS